MNRSNCLALLLVSLFACTAIQAQSRVDIPSYDGFEISAAFYSADSPGPGILLLHQCDRRGPRSGFEELALSLAAAGLQVLVPDYRTYGSSVSADFPAGAWQLAGAHSTRDVDAAFRFLQAQEHTQPEKMAMVGASCGGRYGITLAAEYPEIKALVFLSTLVGAAAFEKYERLAQLPTFSVVSDNDPNGATTRTMHAVYEAGSHPEKRLATYAGDAHGTPLLDQDPALSEKLREWLIRVLAE